MEYLQSLYLKRQGQLLFQDQMLIDLEKTSFKSFIKEAINDDKNKEIFIHFEPFQSSINISLDRLFLFFINMRLYSGQG